MSNRKKREALPRDLEIRGAEIFGKHLSPEKQRALLIVTLTACACPMSGVRMWDGPGDCGDRPDRPRRPG